MGHIGLHKMPIDYKYWIWNCKNQKNGFYFW